MKRFRNILVATDTRLEHHPIVDEAVEVALHSGAKLKICDVVPDFPWTVRLTLRNHEEVHQTIIDEKRHKLDEIVERISGKGVDVQSTVLTGQSSVELIREVQRGKHDLVLRVAKGNDSRSSGYFGNTAKVLLRKCPCAVWLVTPNSTPEFDHVLGCIDTSSGNEADSELNSEVFELAESISDYHSGSFSIIHAWGIWNEQMVKSRMQAGEFEQFEQGLQESVKSSLNEFLSSRGRSLESDNVHLVRGEPAEVIPDFVKQNHVDLVVMGTVARSGMAGVVMGNTAEQILSRIECSVLALKPKSFVTPIVGE